MSDIRNRLLYLAETYPEMSHHFLDLARQGVGEGVPYQENDYDYDYDDYSSEMMAEANRRNLRNPINNSCNPLQKHDDADPNPTSRGSGDCYQKHYEYGSANSSNKKDYMKRYRQLQKAQYGTSGYNTPAPNGAFSEGEGRPKDKRPNPNSVRKKAYLKKNSSAREQLEDFRFRRATWRHQSIRNLRNNSGTGMCFTPLSEWEGMQKGKPGADFIAYVEALGKGDEALGQCYHRHNDYGEAKAGKNKSQARRDYDKWYYENVKKPAMQSGQTKHTKNKRTKTPIKNQKGFIENKIKAWEAHMTTGITRSKMNDDLKQKFIEGVNKLADRMRKTRVTPDVFFAGASKKTKSQLSDAYDSGGGFMDIFGDLAPKSESKPKSKLKSEPKPKADSKTAPKPKRNKAPTRRR